MTKKILIIIFLSLIFCLSWNIKFVQALPIGSLLYRTSDNGRMYGYNEKELIKSSKGMIKNIYSGHVGIYIGERDGEHYVVEALAGGVVKTPAKYFVDLSRKEEFLGAKIPVDLTEEQRLKVVMLAETLAEYDFAYDFDFHNQKGPGSGDWTCVGLTEKLYESANIDNPYDLSQLEYDQQEYGVNITLDGYDDYSKFNSRGDSFSKVREFSKINPYTNTFFPAPEIFGFNAGKQYQGNRYFFLPYTQFLQSKLEDVEVDIQISSESLDADIRSGKSGLGIALKWVFINQPLSAVKKVVDYFNSQKAFVSAEEILTEDVITPEVPPVDLLAPVASALVEKIITKEEEPDNMYEVLRVIDGDTIILTNGQKVRYIGMDTPELKSLFRKNDQCLAWVAKERNQELLKSKKVRLEKDNNLEMDNFGRWLRYVYVKNDDDWIFVNEKLTREGLAEPFLCENNKNCLAAKDQNRISQIVSAYNLAQNQKLGLFSGVCDLGEVEDDLEQNLAYFRELINQPIAKEKMVNNPFERNKAIYDQVADSYPIKIEEDAKTLTKKSVAPIVSSYNPPRFSSGSSSSSSSGETVEPPIEEIVNECVSQLVISRIFAEANNDWIEIYNPCFRAVDLSHENIRLEKAKTAIDPSILIRFNADEDANYIGERIIYPNSYYLIVRDEANEEIKSKAQAIALRDQFTWSGSGYSIFLARDVVSDASDEDIIDLVGFGSDSISFEGQGPATEILINNILVRKETATSTIDILQEKEIDQLFFGYDSDQNYHDFLLWPLEDSNSDSDPSDEDIVNPLNQDLSSLWHFDTCRGDELKNSVLDDSITQVINWDLGKWDCGIQQAYQDDPISFPLSSDLDSNNFTVSLFYKLPADNSRLFLGWENQADNNLAMILSASYSDIYLPNQGRFRTYDLSLLSDNDWHHLAISTELASSSLKIYQDGELSLEKEIGSYLLDFSHLSISEDNNYSYIDELAIFNRTLSLEEIVDIANSSESLNPKVDRSNQLVSEVKHYWSFSEGTGNTVADSISGYNLEIVPEFWSLGISGFGIENQYNPQLEITANLGSFVSEDISMEFWWQNSAYPSEGRGRILLSSASNSLLGIVITPTNPKIIFNNQTILIPQDIIPNDDAWHQVVLVYDSYDYQLRLYVDKEEKIAWDKTWLIEKPNNLKIIGENFYYRLDEIKIFQGILTLDQIVDSYQQNYP